MSGIIPKEEFDARVKRCKEKLRAAGLKGLLVYSYKSGATKYFSGFSPRWSVTNAALYILPLDGEPLMLTRLQFHLPTVLRESVMDNVKVCGAARLGTTPMDSMAEECAAHLAKQGITEGKLGLSGYAPELGVEAPLMKALPKVTFVDANEMVERLRQVKSENEVRLITKSAEIAGYAWEEAMSLAQPGHWEQDVLQEAEYRARKKGATGTQVFFGHVKDGKTYHRPVRRRLEKGDVVRLEVIPEYQGYWTERVSYAAVESSPAGLKESFDGVVQAHFMVVDYMQPGKTIGDVVEYMKKAGSGVHKRLGHGMGLDNIERPETISEQDKTVMEPGMVFAIHPNADVPVYGSLTWGGTVIVTKNGARSLLPKYPEFVV